MLQQTELWTICDPADPIPPGQHVHKCSNCGTYWRHGNDVPGRATREEFEQAHSCPNCGAFENFKYASGEPLDDELMDSDEMAFVLFLSLLEAAACAHRRRR